VYADIDGYRTANVPLAIIPPSIVTTSYHSDIVIYYEQHSKIKPLELTCLFNTIERLQAVHECKSTKPEYQLLLSELDCLGYSILYSTIEIGCLKPYHSELCKLQLNSLWLLVG